MLRINLLPPYIFDKQKKIKLAIVWGVAAAAAIVAFVIWSGSVQARLDEKKKELAEATEFKSQYDDLEKKINDVKAKIADTGKKQTFIANAQQNNDAWPKVYEAMRDVTTDKILLQSLSIGAQNHKALNFVGFAKDEATIARWWMSLRNATDRFDTVALNLPSHPYIPPTAATNGAGMGYGRMMGGGMGSGMGSMSSSMGSSMSSSMGMGGGGMAGMAGNKFANMMRGSGGGGGGFGGANNTAGGETEVEGRRGLNFEGVAMLKDAYAPPIAPMWPAGGGGGGGFGGMGMMGMGGMGMGGMGGGRMSGMPPMSGGGGAPAPPASAGKGKGGDD